MRECEAEVRDQYERWLCGRTPVALYVRWYLRRSGAAYAQPLFDAMSARKLPRVLDVGCATGFYLRWAFDHGHGRERLAGVDLSPVMLGEARQRLRIAVDAGVSVELHEASATELPFSDGSFDAVLCNGVVKYLDDEMLSAFLDEAGRVLVQGGRIAIADFGRMVPVQSAICPPRRLGIPTSHLRTATELSEAVRGRGFTNVREVPLRRLRRIPLSYEATVGTKSSVRH